MSFNDIGNISICRLYRKSPSNQQQVEEAMSWKILSYGFESFIESN